MPLILAFIELFTYLVCLRNVCRIQWNKKSGPRLQRAPNQLFKNQRFSPTTRYCAKNLTKMSHSLCLPYKGKWYGPHFTDEGTDLSKFLSGLGSLKQTYLKSPLTKSK